MIWGAIGWDWKSPLIFLKEEGRKGIYSQAYLNQVLEPVIFPFWALLTDKSRSGILWRMGRRCTRGRQDQCASTSCTALPSYSADPERARAALTSYCLSNGIVSTGTIARAAVATSTSRESYPQEAAYRVA
jgi:hypothetical protein